MAILGKIRQRSLILILVIAMALFSFVLADLFRGGGVSASDLVVATVNGNDIERDDFMQKVEVAQQRSGGRVSNTQALNQVWEQELRNLILDSQYEELGLTVERDQMRGLLKQGLQAFDEFKDEAGEFDNNKLNEFIANLEAIYPDPVLLGNQVQMNYDDWKNYENSLATNGLSQTYFNMVRAGITGTLVDGQLDHQLENDRVDIKYIQIPYSTIPDSTVAVSKEEIAKYVNEHQDQFEVEETRDIQYVQFLEEASPEDEEAIKNDLLSLLEDRVEFNEASKLNDTIVGFNNTDNYEEFVNTNSELKFNPQYLLKDRMPVGVGDSLFAREIGDNYGPYEQAGLFTISKVVDIRQVADSVKSSHIIVPYVGAFQAAPTVTTSYDDARAMVDSILPLVKNNKTKFAEVADEINTDGTKGTGGDIGWTRYANYNPQTFDPDFADFIYFEDEGSVEIVETKFGFHIISIDESKNLEKVIQIANLARTIEPSEATINEVFNKTSKFEIAVADGDYQAVAEENGYEVRVSVGLKELDENIIGLGPQRQIVRWTYEDGVKVGDVKRFPLNNGFVVVRLTAKGKKGLMTTENASVTVLPILRKEKKAEIIRQGIVGSVLEEVANAQGQTVRTAVALNMKNPTLSGAGQEPAVIGAAFGLNEGATSGLIDGNNGVYMVQVTKVTPATELPNYNAASERFVEAKITSVNTALYNALREVADIKDNRAIVY